ncbi:MAG: hypothetical protein MZW92_70490 [Comamonadaceae bacterium]|nr:hypothetical protein [Comamonadaceae bacterium]
MLPDYLGEHAAARRAGRRRRRHRRHRDRVADRAAALPRQPRVRLGAAPAARDAGLRHGLRLHRPAAVRRPGADAGCARAFGWQARRLLVSRRAQRWAGAVVMFVFVLYPYVYLLARTAFLERASGMLEAARISRLRPLGSFFRVSPAAGAAGDRRRRRAGADGDPGRLRHGVLLRRADLHHRHLPRLVLAGRPRRRGAAVGCAARLRRPGAAAGAR